MGRLPTGRRKPLFLPVTRHGRYGGFVTSALADLACGSGGRTPYQVFLDPGDHCFV